MKVSKLDERIHVLDNSSTVISVINDITSNGIQEDAFYVLDIGDIVHKHQIWKEKLPRVEPFYAVKCNDNITVLEVLASIGIGFDCASKSEINKILDLGVDSSKIIFANPAKPASYIRHAATVGVDLMTVDNEIELHKIKKIFPTAKIVIRIRCDADVAQCPLGIKFGCDPTTEAPNILRLANKLGLCVVGFSFHVGSGCQDPPVYRRALHHCRKLFDLAMTMNFKPFLVDIGGGFPGDKGTSIDKFADVINKALDEYFNMDDVQIIAEPGRFYVASAFTLATSIHSKRSIRADYDLPHLVTSNMYYINDGVYGSFNCLLYDHQHVTPIPLKRGSGKMIPSSIWGPTCDGLDQVVENVMLNDMKVGDWFVFENMGAYTLPVASTFNGFPVPKVHVVVNKNVWLLLKDLLPLTEEHFVIGDTPNSMPIGLSGDVNRWNNSELTPEIFADSNSPPAYIYEYVEVDTLN